MCRRRRAPVAAHTRTGGRTCTGGRRGGPPWSRPPPLEDGDGQDKHLYAPVLRRVLHVPALHVSTLTATGPAAPTAGFKRIPMAADGLHPGQYFAAHAGPQGQGKLRLDARERLRGKGVDGHRSALRFRATRDNRGNDAAFPALALTMGKTKTFTMSTFTLPFFAAPNTSAATSCAKSLPSFAAPNTSSATFYATSFTWGVHFLFFLEPQVDL